MRWDDRRITDITNRKYIFGLKSKIYTTLSSKSEKAAEKHARILLHRCLASLVLHNVYIKLHHSQITQLSFVPLNRNYRKNRKRRNDFKNVKFLIKTAIYWKFESRR